MRQVRRGSHDGLVRPILSQVLHKGAIYLQFVGGQTLSRQTGKYLLEEFVYWTSPC